MIVVCPLHVVCRQQFTARRLQRTTPKRLIRILPNLAGMILIWPSVVFQMVPVGCIISRSNGLKIDFSNENAKKYVLI